MHCCAKCNGRPELKVNTNNQLCALIWLLTGCMARPLLLGPPRCRRSVSRSSSATVEHPISSPRKRFAATSDPTTTADQLSRLATDSGDIGSSELHGSTRCRGRGLYRPGWPITEDRNGNSDRKRKRFKRFPATRTRERASQDPATTLGSWPDSDQLISMIMSSASCTSSSPSSGGKTPSATSDQTWLINAFSWLIAVLLLPFSRLFSAAASLTLSELA